MKSEKTLLAAIVILTICVGGWAVACLVGGLAASGWSLSTLLGGWMVAVGTPATLVEFYTQIKGIEYIVCAAFLGFFPVFYKYINVPKEKVRA